MIFINKLQEKVLPIIYDIVNENKKHIVRDVINSKNARAELIYGFIKNKLREHDLSIESIPNDKGNYLNKEFHIIDIKTKEHSFVYLNLDSKLIKDNSYIETDGYWKGCKFIKKNYEIILKYSYITFIQN